MDEVMKINFDKTVFNKTTRENIWDMPLHDHNYDELYYLVDGNINYFIENKSYTVKPGCMVFIPKGVMHKTFSAESWYHEKYVLNFPNDLLPQKLYRTLRNELFIHPIILIPERQRAKVEKIFIGIENEKKYEDEYSSEIIRGYIYQLVATLVRAGAKSVEYISEAQPDYIVKVSEYVEENYNEDIRLPYIAEKLGYSPTYISRKFKEVYGMAFANYVNAYRIIKAVELLEQTDYTITNIATRCGFGNSNYFCRVFREIKGITPHQYRIKFNSVGK